MMGATLVLMTTLVLSDGAGGPGEVVIAYAPATDASGVKRITNMKVCKARAAVQQANMRKAIPMEQGDDRLIHNIYVKCIRKEDVR